jgi:hypothetical protein
MDALSQQCYQQVCGSNVVYCTAHLLVDRAVGHRRLREQLVLLLLDLLLSAQQRLINRATSVG